MTGDVVRLSLIVATLGRDQEIATLLNSLEQQTYKNFEVIFVDQNSDNRVGAILSSNNWALDIKHLRFPHIRGLSAARNIGAKHACGDLFLFPDDDCYYNMRFLEQGVSLFKKKDIDILCGRAADLEGRSINGRFEATPQNVNRRNVFSTQIEWVVFFTRYAFEDVEGYDPIVGVGANSPWLANEGQDITLKAIAKGFKVYYDPGLYGHHPELLIVRDSAMVKKARGYARGMGYVIGKHHYGICFFTKYAFRSLAGAIISAIQMDFIKSSYYLNVFSGRFEGYIAGRKIAR